jgi:hypothetical protein
LIRPRKKSGWNGSLTLSLDRGEKKIHQSGRIPLRTKNALLLNAVHALGVDSLAIDSFSIPIPQRKAQRSS